MKVWIRGLVVFLMLGHQNVYAVAVEGLYKVEVVVKSEQEKDVNTAINQAMQRVLKRTLAGNNIFTDDTVRGVLSNANGYVDEYQLSLSETNNKDERVMRIVFDEESLINTLRPGKLWLWNEVRPRTLLWLVVEDESGTQKLFDSDEMPEIERVLRTAANQKKIPILFPMQDLREKRVLSIADVLSAYSEHLLEVSVRYEVVSTLAGKIVKQGNCWKAEWTLYFDEKIEQWRDSCSTIDAVALHGFQGVYDRLSTFYAAKQKGRNIEEMMMKVSGITRVAEVMRLTEYFEALPAVKTATWVMAEKGYNLYRIFYQGKLTDLNRQVAAEQVLKLESKSKQKSGEMKYRLLNH